MNAFRLSTFLFLLQLPSIGVAEGNIIYNHYGMSWDDMSVRQAEIDERNPRDTNEQWGGVAYEVDWSEPCDLSIDIYVTLPNLVGFDDLSRDQQQVWLDFYRAADDYYKLITDFIIQTEYIVSESDNCLQHDDIIFEILDNFISHTKWSTRQVVALDLVWNTQ